MWTLKKHIRRCQRGVAALEAAIILPIMLLLIFGCMEVYQYYRAEAILDRVSFTVANGVSIQKELFDRGLCDDADDICIYGKVAKDLFQPLDYASFGSMRISLFIAEAAGNGQVSWNNDPSTSTGWVKEFRGVSAGELDSTSRLQDKSVFPPPVVGDTVVVVEVFYQHEPFVMSSRFWAALAGTTQIYSRFFFRPRFDDLRKLS
ncbi:MAG: pilus assembly protein [Burkholderiaceae bacterium]|nr:pilus assembly protein [Burkholderiaceae bacterium]